MNVVVTPADKRKSFALTVVIYTLIMVALFFIRFWPPSNAEELAALTSGGGGGGVTLNFGDSDVGSGDNFKSEVLQVKAQVKVAPSPVAVEDKIIAQENTTEESDVVIPKKEIIKPPKEVIKKEIKPIVEKPKVTKNTNDALSNILSGNNKGGDGDDKESGNKGKSNGSLSSNDYYGNGGSGGGTGGGNGTGNGTGSGSGTGPGSGGGSGGGSGYSLGGRKALNKPQPKYTCDESGKVVVKVSVDRSGNTISVVTGVKGTTNTAPCLLDQAKIAAMNTKWQASENAPEKQVGEIVYNFSLN
jgi:outer membrane biosynthesis protein TonB